MSELKYNLIHNTYIYLQVKTLNGKLCTKDEAEILFKSYKHYIITIQIINLFTT